PSATPTMIPRMDPTTNPPTVSSIVVSTCTHRGPSSVPLLIHVHNLRTISDGWAKKNLSTQPRRVVSSQLPSQTTATRSRNPCTVRRRRRASRTRLAVRSAPPCAAGSSGACTGALSRAAALLPFIANEDLDAQVVPAILIVHGARRHGAVSGVYACS